jgi:hypothetical protein
MGTEDWTYLLAFFPAGRRMVVAEAAGEVSRLAARREAIPASVRGLRID